jgi:hypothetical protein
MKINPAFVWQLPVARGQAHDSTIAGLARQQHNAIVHTKTGRAHDCRVVGLLPYACCVNVHILFLCTLNKHTVRCRLAGAQSGLGPPAAVRVVRNFQKKLFSCTWDRPYRRRPAGAQIKIIWASAGARIKKNLGWVCTQDKRRRARGSFYTSTVYNYRYISPSASFEQLQLARKNWFGRFGEFRIYCFLGKFL